MATFLITGGAGFIGSNIVAELVQRGERVRVLDNFATSKRENIAPFLSQVELIEGDLRHPEAVRQAVEGVDYVLHRGALPSVQRSIEDPLTTNEVNARGTLNLLIAARDAGVKRVVYASSSSIYGDSPTHMSCPWSLGPSPGFLSPRIKETRGTDSTGLPKVETMKPAPKSPYAASKLAGEHYCQVFQQVYELETVCLRYFNVFGPNQDPTSEYAAVIPKFITAMLRGERPVIYGDGLQSRDFTPVVNAVEANLLALDAEGAAGEVFNVACGKRYNLLELIEALNSILDTSLTPIHTPPRSGDVRHSQAGISKAKGMLGYRVEVAFEEGLERAVEWYKSHP